MGIAGSGLVPETDIRENRRIAELTYEEPHMFRYFRDLKIGPRLVFGFGSLLIFMLFIMVAGLFGLHFGSGKVHQLATEDFRKAQLANDVLEQFNENAVNSYVMLMTSDPVQAAKASQQMSELQSKVDGEMKELGQLVAHGLVLGLTGGDVGSQDYAAIVNARKAYLATGDKLRQYIATNDRADGQQYFMQVRLPALETLITAARALAQHQQWRLLNTASKAQSRFDVTRDIIIGLGVISLVLGWFLARLTTRHITGATGRLSETVTRVSAGDYSARANLETGDEFGILGRAFDGMLNERVATLAQKEKENEALNTSIIDLMRAVAKLSRGDLTIKAPVREDVTGALADAINNMADQTAKTLGNVVSVSGEVRSASQDGRDTVLSSARGMNEIRGTIQETGKRIKRLGERSQEITGIVKLIDDIAERTSVLALNANMQAAMAGEAGRGFRVVADEVQRLAERSKEATDQIAKLVTNIQTETNDTMATMDRAIGEVVRGGEMAEKAAQQVTHLDELGGELLQSVEAFTIPDEYRQSAPSAGRRAA